MTCQDAGERVNELLDGTLDAAGRADVERHLASCPDCRAEREGLERLGARTAALPRELAPPRDLWPSLRDQLPPQVATLAQARPASGARRWMAAAAVLILGVAATLLLRSAGDETTGAPDASPAAYGAAEHEYLRATESLLGALDVRREDLSPATLAVVDENLRIIDEAILRVRAAVENDPGGADPQRMIALYGRKVHLLRQAVRLPVEG